MGKDHRVMVKFPLGALNLENGYRASSKMLVIAYDGYTLTSDMSGGAYGSIQEISWKGIAP